MLTLVATVVIAGLFAIFATENTTTVVVNLGSQALHIPLYLVVIIPLILGLLASYFIYMAYTLSLKMTINELKDERKRLKDENANLQKEAHKFELENTKLKSEGGKPVDEDSI